MVSSVPLMKWHDEDSAASAGYDQDRAAWPQTYIHHVDHLGSVTVALFRPSSQDTGRPGMAPDKLKKADEGQRQGRVGWPPALPIPPEWPPGVPAA